VNYLTSLIERDQDHAWIIVGRNKSELAHLNNTAHKFIYVEPALSINNSFIMQSFCPNSTDKIWSGGRDIYKEGKLINGKIDLLNG
jgi:hypothetical protein